MDVAKPAPFCAAPDGGRFVVDVTTPFLAKFGEMLHPKVCFVAAVMRADAPWVMVALRPAGRASAAPTCNFAAVEVLADIVGGTPWPQQEDAEGEHAAAAAAIVDGLSIDDVVSQLPQLLLDCG
jgi:hypothetical protein